VGDQGGGGVYDPAGGQLIFRLELVLNSLSLLAGRSWDSAPRFAAAPRPATTAVGRAGADRQTERSRPTAKQRTVGAAPHEGSRRCTDAGPAGGWPWFVCFQGGGNAGVGYRRQPAEERAHQRIHSAFAGHPNRATPSRPADHRLSGLPPQPQVRVEHSLAAIHRGPFVSLRTQGSGCSVQLPFLPLKQPSCSRHSNFQSGIFADSSSIPGKSPGARPASGQGYGVTSPGTAELGSGDQLGTRG